MPLTKNRNALQNSPKTSLFSQNSKKGRFFRFMRRKMQ